MFVLVIYDVNTSNRNGQKRLRQVAKVCEQYGQRVQNSSFECNLDMAQYEVLKHTLSEVIDKDDDNLRFYNLGNKYKSKIEYLGKNKSFAQDDLLVF